MTNSITNPVLHSPGLFGAALTRNGETIHLRMERLNEASSKAWLEYAERTSWVANNDSRGVLSNLLSMAGKSSYPDYATIQDVTGFTPEEFTQFSEKLLQLKAKRGAQIVETVKATSSGSNHISTAYSHEKYIVYATTNPHFSIEAIQIPSRTLKSYIEAYREILITVGSDFSVTPTSFHNRGIFRNPYWVIEEKYAGLSMLLHGLTGAVAQKFFPEKITMEVMPIGSMQAILKKHLMPGEAYVTYRNGDTKDLTELSVSPDDPEGPLTSVKVAALAHIFFTQ